MPHRQHLLLLLLLLCVFARCCCLELCNLTICLNVPHLGCDNDLTFHGSCRRHRRLVNMQNYQQYLLKIHNKYREQLAAGRVLGVLPARRMPELVWHSGLALLAEYHVKRCLQHLRNYCNALPGLPTPPAVNYGQSLLNLSDVDDYKPCPNSEQITMLAEQWLHRLHLLATAADIAELQNIVYDRNSHLGCAAAEDYDRNVSRFVLVCYLEHQYAGSLKRLYRTGNFSASNCALGRSQTYAHLCQTTADILS
ncbi:antigen 5 like allergen Cul n 1 [Drosophila busckii]|uniref:antigen 5 like allergen Cul n 1 n=1 Tax=Drosophila busckii TaxID=30019 RepID=UPI00083EF753|nr:antigen 5 like allergen Cul n 1 [Drosophila busckii]